MMNATHRKIADTPTASSNENTLATTSEQGTMHSMVFGQSLLALYLQERALISTQGYIPPDVTVHFGGQKRQAIKVVYDPGNGAAKLCTLYPHGARRSQYCCLVIPNKWQAATKQTSGKRPMTFQVLSDDMLTPDMEEEKQGGQSIRFHIGDDAFKPKPLSHGATHLRLPKPAHRRFWQASIIKLLKEAGYKPGEYVIALTLAVRNEEIQIDETGEPQLDPRLNPVLDSIEGVTYKMQCINSNGTKEDWEISIHDDSVQYPQSLGMFFSCVYGADGKPVIENALPYTLVIDLGEWDTQKLKVQWLKGQDPITQGSRVCPGSIDLAAALKDALIGKYKDSIERLDNAVLQHILDKKETLILGKLTEVDDIVNEVIKSFGADLLDTIFSESELQEGNYRFLIGGGGVNHYSSLLERQMEHMARLPYEHYLLLDTKVTRVANAIGGMHIANAYFHAVGN